MVQSIQSSHSQTGILNLFPCSFFVWLVESKSLKLYLASFRNHGAFHEDCTVAIGKRIAELLQPHYLRIGGYWYPRGGMPIDVSGVGFGQNEGFAFQARAFLEEVAGIPEADSLPRNASFDEGVHNMEILAAVAESAANNGKTVTL